jgi:hypothetical protein
MLSLYQGRHVSTHLGPFWPVQVKVLDAAIFLVDFLEHSFNPVEPFDCLRNVEMKNSLKVKLQNIFLWILYLAEEWETRRGSSSQTRLD